MAEKRPPRAIATINFKDGVGKTTVTWCLGDLMSTYGDVSTILFDLDAQMSLTQAITLNEDGSLYRKVSDWSERSAKRKKTIFHAIEAYTGGSSFDFGLSADFIYRIQAGWRCRVLIGDREVTRPWLCDTRAEPNCGARSATRGRTSEGVA